MGITYDLIEPIKDPQKATEFLGKNFLPLFDEFWEKEGKDYYQEKIWDIKAIDFTELWMRGTLTLILAKKDNEPVGFLLGAILRPLLYEKRMLRVETWYGKSAEVEKGLFEYLANGLKFMQVDEILIPDIIHATGVRSALVFCPQNYSTADRNAIRYLRK